MGQINPGSITAGTVVNTDIAVGAAIATDKLQHSYMVSTDFGKADDGGTITATEYTIVVPQGAVSLTSVKAWLMTTGTTTDIDFDLLVAGSSVLTALINITNADGDGVPTAGAISSASVVGGSTITLAIDTVTSSTGALGPRMQVSFDSAAILS